MGKNSKWIEINRVQKKKKEKKKKRIMGKIDKE